jgi:mannose-6-phosphate isomerase-like protein (cupin superfamily)
MKARFSIATNSRRSSPSVNKSRGNEAAASARIFRVCRPTPAHYHATCDEYLYVLSGKGSF